MIQWIIYWTCNNVLHGKTMDSIGISTDGKLDNGDDQTITARNGESVLNSCAYYVMMIGTKDQLVYDSIRIKTSTGNAFYITVQMAVHLVSILHELYWLNALSSCPLLTHYWHINVGINCLRIKRRLMRIKSFKIWGAINTCHGRNYLIWLINRWARLKS
jgi:hypothetical protein